MTDVWARTRQVLAFQLGILVLGTGALLVTPLGLGYLAPVGLLAVLMGAHTWAIRVGRAQDALGKDDVREMSARVGLVLGGVVAVSYFGVGLIPGQLSLPWAGLVAVSVALGIGGGFACMVLTLCGLDMGRA